MNRRHLLSLMALASSRAGAQQANPGSRALPQLQPMDAATLKAVETAARAEGRLHSLGMPDTWANWGGIWADLKRLHGIEHSDEDMDSAEEIVRMESEGARATVDIGDVGFEFGAVARGRGISRPHKPQHWAQIPAWARDEDGFWALAYTGTICFAVNTRRTGGRVPRSWKALFEGGYTVQIGAVGSSAQSGAAVLAAAVALGGDETRLQPALDRMAPMARQGRLLLNNGSAQALSRGTADVYLLWDFVALGYRDQQARPADFEVLIPGDGSITSGYTTIINKHAPHPNAALLAREYIYSDAGQTQLARGLARPIRYEHLDLPPAVRSRLLAPQQYLQARALRPFVWAWELRKLSQTWQDEVVRQAPR